MQAKVMLASLLTVTTASLLGVLVIAFDAQVYP